MVRTKTARLSPFGARDGHVVPRRAEDEQRESEGEQPGGSTGARRAPVQPDDGDYEKDDRRRGQQPVDEREVWACHEERNAA